MILCPTREHNKTYKQCPWLWSDPEVYVLDPGERLQDYLRAFYLVFKGEPTLFIIDDCTATKALTKKKDMLSELAFSGRHADISVWVLTQKYNSVLKDLREQTRWVAFFHCKDRNSFEDCLRENDVIPTREKRALVRQQLAERKHAKFLFTDQPARPEHREGLTNWTPWVLGACLAGGALVFLRNAQNEKSRVGGGRPVDSAPKQPAPGAKQLKTRDTFYME